VNRAGARAVDAGEPPGPDGRPAETLAARRRRRRRFGRRWIRPGHEVLLLTLLALAVRLLAWRLRPAVLTDTVDLFEATERFRAEGWSALAEVRHHPLAVALLALVPTGADLETWGSVGAAVLASLAVGPLHVITRCTGGRHAATFAGLLYAVLPKLVSISSVPLAEAVFLPLFAMAFSSALVSAAGRTRARRVGRAALSGVLAGLAYLARPEGLVAGAAVTVAATVRGRRGERLRAAAVAAVAFVAVAAPYVVQLSSAQGRLALSTKKDVASFAGVADAPRDGGADDSGLVGAVQGLGDALWGGLGVALVLVVIGALPRKRWSAHHARSSRIVLLAAAAVLCAALMRLRDGWGYGGGRHAAAATVLLLPFAGEGMVTVVGFLSRAVRRRRAAMMLATILVIPLAVEAVLRPDGESGARERALGERIAADQRARGGGDVVIATFRQPLVAYYADRTLRDPSAAVRGSARNLRLPMRRYGELLTKSADLDSRRASLTARLREERAQWLVLRFWDGDGPERRPGEDLAAALVADGVIEGPVLGSEDLAAFRVR
jgi:hypothetical protein